MPVWRNMCGVYRLWFLYVYRVHLKNYHQLRLWQVMHFFPTIKAVVVVLLFVSGTLQLCKFMMIIGWKIELLDLKHEIDFIMQSNCKNNITTER